MFELTQFADLEWGQAARHLTPAVRSVLERVLESRDARDLPIEECRLLASVEGDDLVGLLLAANELRRAIAGELITYVINRNINFTNVCFVGCKFCGFSRGPRQSDAYFLSLEQIAEKTVEAAQRGATEVCIQGGLPRDLPPYHYRDILHAVKAAVPVMHTHAFSPMEILHGTRLTGLNTREYLLMLKEAGLDTMPGTAAEVLDDEVRAVVSGNKLNTATWRDIVTTAHQCGIRTTSTLMYGHIETVDHWVRQLCLLRDMQRESGGFTEFVPLGFIHQNTVLFRQGIARSGPTLAEHLKVHALARVLLAGSIANIQVSWVKLDRPVAQACLRAGANDYGGTLMEESISRLAGATAGEYLSPDEFQARILELGRIPAERNTTYTRIQLRAGSGSSQPVQEQMA